MYLDEYYSKLITSLNEFEKSDVVKSILKNASADDRKVYENYKSQLTEHAEIGKKGTSPEATQADKISCYFAAKKIIDDLFDSDEIPYKLQEAGGQLLQTLGRMIL